MWPVSKRVNVSGRGEDDASLIERVSDAAIAEGQMFKRQRMNHFKVATTAIAIAIPSVRLAARWNHRRRSAKRSSLKTAGAK
jgi:hypothetical protein